MVIVIIHWKIREGDEHRQAFLQHWKETLTIEERNHLIGEFLSEPFTPGEVDFDVTILGVPESAPYQSYFNVGMWASLESFEEQVIEPYVGSRPEPKTFEYEYRSRMVLAPLSWRRGHQDLPNADHLT
jgi:hypothetical protein